MGIEALVPIFAIVTPFFLVGWIVYTVSSGKRRSERLKATSEFHAKLFERMGSMKEFGEFMDTEGGKAFMNTLSADTPNSAAAHIVRSVENGVICLSIGGGVLLLRWLFPEIGGGFTIIGTIVLACGVGLLLSCGASYGLSRKFGLLNGTGSEPGTLQR
jgi:hypothetical protein